jgi:hypothetical protein
VRRARQHGRAGRHALRLSAVSLELHRLRHAHWYRPRRVRGTGVCACAGCVDRVRVRAFCAGHALTQTRTPLRGFSEGGWTRLPGAAAGDFIGNPAQFHNLVGFDNIFVAILTVRLRPACVFIQVRAALSV